MTCTCATFGHCLACEPQRQAHAPALPPLRDLDKGTLGLLRDGLASGWEVTFDDLEVDCA